MKLNNKQSGFSIIEVLIVLAIAGLIMVIVFLAVPALQRNSRNTQRTNDAARIIGAINECTANNNGNLANCNTTALLANYITMANNQQLVAMTAAAIDNALFTAGQQCNNANASVAGGGPRAFTITYLVETQGGTAPRCIGS